MKFDEDEILKEAKTRYKEGREHASAWRKEAKKCFNFRAGNQWSDEDRAQLTDQMRMPTTFNRIDPYVRAVAGLEAGNRQEVRFIPREQGDVGVNELYTETVRWIRDQADAEFEEAEAFLDTFISGIGATETYLDYDKDPEGMVCIDHLDCINEVVWDCNAKKRNLTDRKYDFRIKRDMDHAEIKAMFPDKADLIGGADWDVSEDDEEPWNRDPNQSYKQDNDSAEHGKKKKYTLIDYQWCERKTYRKMINPQSGQMEDVTDEAFAKHDAAAKEQGIDLIGMKLASPPMKRMCWYRAFIVGGTIMEVGESPSKNSSTRTFITGYRDTNRHMWYGMVRAMIDPQEWANKFFSQILHMINSNSSGGAFAEVGAFVDIRKAEKEWADPSAIILLKPGGLAKIQQRQPAPFPASLDRLMQVAISALGDVTGIPLEMIGMVDRDQAGVLEAERKKTGITMLAALFDSLKQYRKEQGTLLLYYIQEYLSDGRLVRINGQEGQQYVPLTRMSDTVKFDVIVDEMPQSPNNKERVFSILSSMLPTLMQAGMPPEMLAEFIKYSPLPESFSMKMKQSMDKAGQQNQQAQQQIQQMGQQLQQATQQIQAMEQDKQLEAQKIQIEAEKMHIDGQKIQVDYFNAETNRMKVVQESQPEQAPDMSRQDVTEAEKMQFEADVKMQLERMKIEGAKELEILKQMGKVESQPEYQEVQI